VAVERYSRSGRLTLQWARRTAQGITRTDEIPEEAADALHTLTANAVLFRRGFDLELGVTAGYELNRHFEDDAFNLNGSVGLRWSY
jgi:hypothetical protein